MGVAAYAAPFPVSRRERNAVSQPPASTGPLQVMARGYAEPTSSAMPAVARRRLHAVRLASALLGPPSQLLVIRRDYAHRLLGFQIVRVFCPDQDFPGA